MTVPGLPLSRIRTVAESELSSGRVVAVERGREWQVGITVGTAGRVQVLLNDPEGRASAVELTSLRMTRVLDLGPATDLVLKVDRDGGEARRWDHVVGCLGVTRLGLVLCAAAGRCAFGDWRAVFVGVESDWTVLSDVQDLVHQGLWFTQWQLSLVDAHEHPHRIVGNPDWSARQR
jgi:hypothetical protein